MGSLARRQTIYGGGKEREREREREKKKKKKRELPVSNWYEAGRAQEPMWTLWRREKCPAPAGNPTRGIAKRQTMSPKLTSTYNGHVLAHLA
jgi:hypothetical protein